MFSEPVDLGLGGGLSTHDELPENRELRASSLVVLCIPGCLQNADSLDELILVGKTICVGNFVSVFLRPPVIPPLDMLLDDRLDNWV